MKLDVNYPEMYGETEAPIQAMLAYGDKYRVTTPEPIDVKRGIRFDGIVDEFGANNMPNKRAGYYKYYMTPAAFDKFCKTHETTLNILLD